MADVKWIKLTVNMFDNQKIKYIRTLPEGNNIVLIWIMLITIAGRCNSNGRIFLTDDIPYTPKMLADELKFEENTVMLALNTLEMLGMIVTFEGYISIASWEEHQNIEGLEKIREQNRLRKQKQREREKTMLLSDESMSRDMSREVTQQNKNKNKNKNIDTYYVSIVEYLNKVAGTHFKSGTAATRTKIRARLNEGFTVEDFKTVIDKKCSQWLNDKEMRKFIRPETLFGTKFESYLNEKSDVNIKSSQDDDMDDFLKEMDLI